jgi:hypothetical protein
MTPVGQSWRTPGKHDLLKKITGREVGVTRNFGVPYVMIDLCAGDGRNTDSSGTCSPRILTGHRDLELNRYGRRNVRVVLIEKSDATYAELQSAYPDELTIHGDARRLPEILPDGVMNESDYAFLQNDPNNINDWALSNAVMSTMPRFTTTYSTLGCNVGGLKRLPIEERQPWRDRLDGLLHNMPSWHDALLIALNGDSAQWAYLITGPSKWREVYVREANRAFGQVNHGGLTMAWWKQNRPAFDRLTDFLFLQAKEREETLPI